MSIAKHSRGKDHREIEKRVCEAEALREESKDSPLSQCRPRLSQTLDLRPEDVCIFGAAD